MLILSIETSASHGSVAFLDDQKLLADQALELGKKHAQSLILSIHRIVAAANRRIEETELIAVSIGPGSYTGLRVGVVAAKTIAYALNRPLVAVDTLQAIAVNSPNDIDQIDVVADAQRGDLFVGRYRQELPGQWECEQVVEVLSADSWIATLDVNRAVSGPGLEKLADRIPNRGRILARENWIPNAITVGRLGLRAFLAGETVDSAAVEPLYLRRSSAEVQWERLHPRQ